MNSWLDSLLAKLGLPKAVRDVLVHVVLVFLAAFAAQVSVPAIIQAVGAGKPNWSALAALVTSAAAAGVSAAAHYLTGLVPNAPVTVAPAKPPVPPAP